MRLSRETEDRFMKNLAAALAASALTAFVAFGSSSAQADEQAARDLPSDYHACLNGGWQRLVNNFGKVFLSQQRCTEFVGLGGVLGAATNDYNAGIFLTNETGKDQ